MRSALQSAKFPHRFYLTDEECKLDKAAKTVVITVLFLSN